MTTFKMKNIQQPNVGTCWYSFLLYLVFLWFLDTQIERFSFLAYANEFPIVGQIKDFFISNT